jgi:hypothetical protein
MSFTILFPIFKLGFHAEAIVHSTLGNCQFVLGYIKLLRYHLQKSYFLLIF